MIIIYSLRLVFPSVGVGKKRKRRKEEEEEEEEAESADRRPCLIVEPYCIPNRGPYPFNRPRK